MSNTTNRIMLTEAEARFFKEIISVEPSTIISLASNLVEVTNLAFLRIAPGKALELSASETAALCATNELILKLLAVAEEKVN